MKTKPLIVLLAVVVFGLTLILTSSPAFAQNQRGAIVVINDWDESVDLTVLMERHDEMITKHWEIAPRVRTYLLDESGERKVRASARDRIKIKSYARPVAIGDVGGSGMANGLFECAPFTKHRVGATDTTADGAADFRRIELRGGKPAACAPDTGRNRCQAEQVRAAYHHDARQPRLGAFQPSPGIFDRRPPTGLEHALPPDKQWQMFLTM
jgi:hypothetical protein